MMAAATVAEGASVSASPVSGAAGNVESPEAEGEGVGAAGEEKDAATRGAEAAGDSEEDGEDVFEVEKILDMKTEGVGVRRGGGVGRAGRAGRAVRRERRGFCGGRRAAVRTRGALPSCALDVGGKEQDRWRPASVRVSGADSGCGRGLVRVSGAGLLSGTLAGLRGWGREASEVRRLPQDPRRCRRASSRGPLLCSGRRLWAGSHPRPGFLSSVQCSPKLWSVFCLKIHGDSRSSPIHPRISPERVAFRGLPSLAVVFPLTLLRERNHSVVLNSSVILTLDPPILPPPSLSGLSEDQFPWESLRSEIFKFALLAVGRTSEL